MTVSVDSYVVEMHQSLTDAVSAVVSWVYMVLWSSPSLLQRGRREH